MAASSPSRPNPKPLIVVVEDEADLASLIAQFLERAGMRVQVCNRASHAIKFLQRNFANLVLLDLVLPDQSGFELYEDLKAANITNDTLQRTPDLVAIFCANDDMALGSVEAARAASKDKLIVIGVDGNINAVKSIKAGRLNASVAQLPYLVGMQAVENVKKLLAGDKVQETINVPTLVLTKEVIEANKDPMLQYVK